MFSEKDEIILKEESIKLKSDYFLVTFVLIIIIILVPISFAEINDEVSKKEFQKVSYDPIIITSDADFGPSRYNLPGSGTFGDPYRIDKYNINTQADYAIEVRDVVSFFVVESNSLKGSSGGLYISSILPGHASISNNSFIKIEEGTGIVLSSAEQVEIRNNNFLDTNTAIDCSFSADVEIIDNDIKFGYHGIIVRDSPGALINSNKFLSLTGISIRLQDSQFSQILLNQINETSTALILESNYVAVCTNVVYANTQGILIKQSIGSKFYDNFIYHNLGGAIYISSLIQNLRKDNVFYHNFFIANSGGNNPQAISSGTNNTWYNPKSNEGNYWSDANKTGPYYLQGAVDLYPLTTTDRDNDGLDDINERYVYFTDLDSNDSDLDNLLDGEEIYTYFTSPSDSDSDNDRLNDGEEVLIYGTNALDPDTDDDMLDDYEEIKIYFTNAFDPDTDNDTMIDGWEVMNGLDPLVDDSALDYDDDELSNVEEYNIGTHPLLNDTDFDGLLDGLEVKTYSTNPLDEDSDGDNLLDGEEILVYFTDALNPDSDNDTLPDGVEVNVYFTSPLSNDTDLDGLPDPWEIEYDLNPLFDDSSFDPDNDSLSNLGEYLAGTHPLLNDTDGDNFLDGKEVRAGTDPLDPDDYPLTSRQKLLISISSIAASVIFVAILSSIVTRIRKF